eukprot:TRINITY_DN794_c0_g1_i4.p1 TRINITY_DN794_c0_g1~~TRINITY_DN794_c0_g1_i4.p1  ORF type:complete len:214 (-),score=-0.96 TRINITY_DN794_c0_g1_i4:29-670(-)
MSTSVIQAWNKKGNAYAKFCENYEIFSVFCKRLVSQSLEEWDRLERTSESKVVIDVGCGSGLMTHHFLNSAPNVTHEVYLTDPAESMLEICKERFQNSLSSLRFCKLAGEEIGKISDSYPHILKGVDLIVSSATMHLVDEDPFFESAPKLLKDGGLLAFNLWWHSLDETKDEIVDHISDQAWREPLALAIRELFPHWFENIKPTDSPKKSSRI